MIARVDDTPIRRLQKSAANDEAALVRPLNARSVVWRGSN
jgi:hypothetical protein